MESEVIKLVATNGAFAVLFVWLLFNTQKENAKREADYRKTIEKNQNVITELTKNLNVVTEVKEDVEYIKNKLK